MSVKIRTKVVRGQTFILTGDNLWQCPNCRRIHTPDTLSQQARGFRPSIREESTTVIPLQVPSASWVENEL